MTVYAFLYNWIFIIFLNVCINLYSMHDREYNLKPLTDEEMKNKIIRFYKQGHTVRQGLKKELLLIQKNAIIQLLQKSGYHDSAEENYYELERAKNNYKKLTPDQYPTWDYRLYSESAHEIEESLIQAGLNPVQVTIELYYQKDQCASSNTFIIEGKAYSPLMYTYSIQNNLLTIKKIGKIKPQTIKLFQTISLTTVDHEINHLQLMHGLHAIVDHLIDRNSPHLSKQALNELEIAYNYLDFVEENIAQQLAILQTLEKRKTNISYFLNNVSSNCPDSSKRIHNHLSSLDEYIVAYNIASLLEMERTMLDRKEICYTPVHEFKKNNEKQGLKDLAIIKHSVHRIKFDTFYKNYSDDKIS